MQKTPAALLFYACVAAAAAFVWLTGRALPAVVASHFAASGAANGFMPRDLYLPLMLALVIVTPVLLVLLPQRMFDNPALRINVPYRDYWLAPERRPATIAFLRRQSRRFGALLTVFLCYAHWLVVRANALHPPELSSVWFNAGLAIFLLATLAWVIAMLKRFRDLPAR